MRTRNIFLIIVFFALMGGVVRGFASVPAVVMKIDSVQMMIGEQTWLHLEVSYEKGDKVEMPIFSDTLTQDVEIVEVGKCDTLYSSEDKEEVRQSLLLTSFNEGLHHIPPIPVQRNGEVFYSNDAVLKVLTYKIDSTDTRIFDIKPILKAPFVWADFHLYLVLFLWLLFLLFVIIYLRQHWQELKAGKDIFHQEEPPRPPFEVAMEELERIKEEKIYLNHQEKAFYTQLTDVIRIYIKGRFGVNAMEMTSSEILNIMQRNKETKEVFEKLKQILSLSDFVKFAKIEPTEFENECSIMNAFSFVRNTEPQPEEPQEESKEKGGKK